jgi:chaperone modulatory protein CbpM
MKGSISIDEARAILGIDVHFIVHTIRLRWIIPADPAEAQLDEEDFARLRLICELKHDLGVNDEGISIILHLLDQLHLMQSALTRAA